MLRHLLVALTCLALSALAVTQLAAQDPPKPTQDPSAKSPLEVLEELSWICGTWAKTEGGVTVEEHWRPLKGTTILGTSHTYDDKKTRFHEFLRVQVRVGKVSYVALPGGGAPTLFRLARHGTGPDGALVGSFADFENPQHDHPQRIRYERTAKGITATIEQLDGTRRTEFVLDEVK